MNINDSDILGYLYIATAVLGHVILEIQFISLSQIQPAGTATKHFLIRP